MLATRQKVLRNFWYATLPLGKLDDGPKPFRLLGQDIVLFLDDKGQPKALEDRCRHRTAKLSKGWIRDGRIVCGYHGWEYDSSGELRRIPQFPSDQSVPETYVPSFHARERYGYVWVCLGEPLMDIPDLPQEGDPAFRRIHQFDDRWNCSALRMMENSFDNSHFSFVHKSTFGDIDQPKPEKVRIDRDGLRLRGRNDRPGEEPAAGPSRDGYEQIRGRSARCATLGTCRSAGRWTWNTHRV